MHTVVEPTIRVGKDDKQQIERLADALRLANPALTYAVEENEEGRPYVHFGTPDGILDYFIEPTKGGWRGSNKGPYMLPKVARKATAGAVALAVGLSWVADLVQLTEAARFMLGS